MTARQYPTNRCQRHPDVFLLDVLEQDGTISRACPRCVPLTEINVVRGLYARRKPQ